MFTLGRKYFLWLSLKTQLLVLFIGLLGTVTVVLVKARKNNLLTPWKEASIGNLVRFLLSKFLVSIFVWYSFQQTGLLNASSNSFTSFTLSLLDKIKIGMNNFVFVILNVILA